MSCELVRPVRVIKRGRYRDGVLVASDQSSVTVRFDDEPPAFAPLPDTVTFPRRDVTLVAIPDGDGVPR